MKYQRPCGTFTRLMVGILAVTLVAGCNPESATQNSKQVPGPQATTSVPQESFQVESSTQEMTAQVYWLDATADTVKLIPRPLSLESKNVDDREALEVAFQQLLTGPKEEAFVSEIPEGTKLLGVSQKAEGIYVNLSEEVEKGGGTMSMTGRLAQILYTATSVNSNANVWFQIEGETREVFGGEGLVLEQPLSRKSFEANFDL